jgi:hypothetical protein
MSDEFSTPVKDELIDKITPELRRELSTPSIEYRELELDESLAASYRENMRKEEEHEQLMKRYEYCGVFAKLINEANMEFLIRLIKPYLHVFQKKDLNVKERITTMMIHIMDYARKYRRDLMDLPSEDGQREDYYVTLNRIYNSLISGTPNLLTQTEKCYEIMPELREKIASIKLYMPIIKKIVENAKREAVTLIPSKIETGFSKGLYGDFNDDGKFEGGYKLKYLKYKAKYLKLKNKN